MNRNNTNFSCKVYDALKQALESSELPDKLLYYQKLVVEYAKMSDKGLYLWHGMGLGKTLESIALCMALGDDYVRIIVTPKSLQQNYRDGIKKYNEIMGGSPNFKPADESNFNFVVKSHIINKNIARILGPEQLFEQERTPIKLNSIKKKVVMIIDEAHQISQLISNGSDEWCFWYNTLLNSPSVRVFMLSGSLFSASPFELVPICNILANKRLFPENYDQFMSLFWNNTERKMINRGAFQNRLYGLFSHMSLTYLEKETTNLYPRQEPTQIVKCPMGQYQLESYMLARSKEIDEKKVNGERKSKPIVKKFEAPSKDSASYRVRSRQYSNFAPPPEVEELYNKGDYTMEDLNNILSKISAEYFETTKIKEVHKISNKHKGSKGLIFSQFVGIGGGGAVAESYRRVGYEEFTVKSNPTDKPKPRFAMINGSLSIEEQAKILSLYESPANDDSSIIEFLIIGLQQTTGLDLTCVRWVIMLEPYWADYIRAQLFARANRYKSHLRLPEEKRTVTPYIMISTYPSNIDEKILRNRQTKLTTDEHLYRAMEYDAQQSEEFKKAIREIAIECSFIKEKNPDHVCRVCAPNNKQLFTDDMDPNQAIAYDASRCDPCDLTAKESVDAIIVKVNDSTYYAVKDENKYGYLVFYKVGDEYEEIKPASPIFKEVINAIQKN